MTVIFALSNDQPDYDLTDVEQKDLQKALALSLDPAEQQNVGNASPIGGDVSDVPAAASSADSSPTEPELPEQRAGDLPVPPQPAAPLPRIHDPVEERRLRADAAQKRLAAKQAGGEATEIMGHEVEEDVSLSRQLAIEGHMSREEKVRKLEEVQAERDWAKIVNLAREDKKRRVQLDEKSNRDEIGNDHEKFLQTKHMELITLAIQHDAPAEKLDALVANLQDLIRNTQTVTSVQSADSEQREVLATEEVNPFELPNVSTAPSASNGEGGWVTWLDMDALAKQVADSVREQESQSAAQCDAHQQKWAWPRWVDREDNAEQVADSARERALRLEEVWKDVDDLNIWVGN